MSQPVDEAIELQHFVTKLIEENMLGPNFLATYLPRLRVRKDVESERESKLVVENINTVPHRPKIRITKSSIEILN